MAWKYCSRYVLLYYADDNHMVRCATSGVYMPINSSKCHAGHFVKVYNGTKTHFATAFDFENIAPQSHQENVYKGGNELEMYRFLVKQHGQSAINKLELRKHNICKLDKFTMDYWKKHYKQKFDELVKIKGNPWR